MPTIAPQLAEVAQLVADPGRTNILSTLMDGRALTASKLARVAGVAPQTTSSHLAKLVERELLAVEKRGPRRFYRLATPLVAQMLEGIMTVAATGPPIPAAVEDRRRDAAGANLLRPPRRRAWRGIDRQPDRSRISRARY